MNSKQTLLTSSLIARQAIQALADLALAGEQMKADAEAWAALSEDVRAMLSLAGATVRWHQRGFNRTDTDTDRSLVSQLRVRLGRWPGPYFDIDAAAPLDAWRQNLGKLLDHCGERRVEGSGLQPGDVVTMAGGAGGNGKSPKNGVFVVTIDDEVRVI